MPVVSPDEFARLVGSMDADVFASFVADVWAARGWETTVDDGTVRASGGPGAGEETIGCLVRRRWGRRRRLPDEPFDVVVVATGPEGTATADYPDTRTLGAPELRGLLLYGIDRETADTIFVRHFGRSIWSEEPDRPVVPIGLPTRQRAVVVGVVVLAVTAALLTIGGWGLGALGSWDDPMAAVTPAPPQTSPTAGAPRASRYPAGIDGSGLTDLDALIAGHRRATVNRSFELLIIHQRSVDLLAPERTWIASRQTAHRLNATRFHYRVTGLEAAPDGNLTIVVYDDFADGSYTYRRITSSESQTYRRGVVPTAGGDGAFTVVGAAYLRRYLATAESRVELITPAYPALYRVVATGTPNSIPGPVENYSAEAVVDEEGVVHRLTVEYRRSGSASTTATASEDAATGTEVRFELVYSDVGQTGVPTPPWYGEARAATNGTLAELRSPESLWWSQPIGVDYRDD